MHGATIKKKRNYCFMIHADSVKSVHNLLQPQKETFHFSHIGCKTNCLRWSNVCLTIRITHSLYTAYKLVCSD